MSTPPPEPLGPAATAPADPSGTDARSPAPAAPSATPGAPPARLEPARRLGPRPTTDRAVRTATIATALPLVGLLVVGLLAASLIARQEGARFTDVPAAYTLGAPESLTLRSDLGTVRVLASPAVTEVTAALVEPGQTQPPAADELVRASISVTGDTAHPTLEIAQPGRISTLPGHAGPRDVLLLIPAGQAPDLTVLADLGDVEISGVPTEHLEARTDTGDVAVQLPSGAQGTADVTADLGNVTVRIAGDATWEVEATTDLGDVRVDPAIRSAEGTPVGTLRARSDLGDVTVSR